MKMYVGVTDYDLFSLLRERRSEEVNFWTPGGSKQFRALRENELYLFKLHAPRNCIAGGGFFVRSSILPASLAWDTFGPDNGVSSREQLELLIRKYKRRNNMDLSNPRIGCIVLADPFFFDEKDWIPAPEDWSTNIVQGKTYDTETAAGAALYESVLERLPEGIRAENTDGYRRKLVRHRMGQGAFRVSVIDAYGKRCAITGEETLPVLRATHIRPPAFGGEHLVSNGMLLRSDWHTLFDSGYVTVDPDYNIYVSGRLREDYGDGGYYYAFHGEKLQVLPDSLIERPRADLLEWHNENVFRG